MTPNRLPIVIRAGPLAAARIRADGLAPGDVAVVPAAAGGPKGLILHGLDAFVFGEWLPRAPRERHFVGASIGAWRMASALHPDPVGAFRRLARLYAGQRYPRKPTAAYVTGVCRELVGELVAGATEAILNHPRHRLSVLTVRGRGPLERAETRRSEAFGFALAAAANAAGRARLARFLERVVFHDPRDGAHWLGSRFDAFHTRFAALSAANLREALLASASIPLVLEAVTGIAQAPPGAYWDGGIIDYHLHLPWPRADGLVLYPHFVDHVVPGWLDKSFPLAARPRPVARPRGAGRAVAGIHRGRCRTASCPTAATSSATASTTKRASATGTARSAKAGDSRKRSRGGSSGPTRGSCSRWGRHAARAGRRTRIGVNRTRSASLSICMTARVGASAPLRWPSARGSIRSK